MKKNTQIIQISGFKGLLTAIFIAVCLAAGFIGFPGLVSMTIWNHFTGSFLPEINIYQGILLWSIFVLIYFIRKKKTFSVSFAKPNELTEEEMDILMERAKMQSRARMINKVMLKKLEEVKHEEVSENENASDNEVVNK